jgi:hypothetical protein
MKPMAKTLTASITVVNAVTQIKKWKVVDYQDLLSAPVPAVRVQVLAYQNDTAPYGLYWLIGYDAQNSLCLLVNPTPASMTDQLILGWQDQSASTPYTTITTAHDSASGNNKQKLLAVEAALISTGLVSAALAGT